MRSISGPALLLALSLGTAAAQPPSADAERAAPAVLSLGGATPEAARTLRVRRDAAMFAEPALRRTDERLGLEVLSAFSEADTDGALADLQHVAGFCLKTFLDPAAATPAGGDRWVTLALLDRASFDRWARASFGAGARSGFSAVGGAYDHDRRRLVARDLGHTLRHELVHVLQWRTMDARDSEVPIDPAWWAEGTAALLESFDPGPDADAPVVPAPNWRTNIAKRRLDAGRLPALSALLASTNEDFQARRPLARYAHARAFALYLHERHSLASVQAALDETLAQDPTGASALEAATGATPAELDADFRAWLGGIPTVPETGAELPVALGISLAEGGGAGPSVVGVSGRELAEAGLRAGDIITSLDGRPTRDLQEFLRVAGTLTPGRPVEVAFRSPRGPGRAIVSPAPR